MGYWFPPQPSAFDPAPRPCGQDANGQPNHLDYEWFILNKRGNQSNAFRWPYKGSTSDSGINKDIIKYNLDSYLYLITKCKTPDDPITGGLAGDILLPNNQLQINYYDFADRWPIRKRIRFFIKPDNSVETYIDVWNSNTQSWGSEGPDFEKWFVTNISTIVSVLGTIMAAAASAVGQPQLGAAFAYITSLGAKGLAQGKLNINPTELLGALGGTLMPIVKTPEIQKLANIGFLSELGKIKSPDWLTKISDYAKQYKNKLPSVDLIKSSLTASYKIPEGNPIITETIQEIGEYDFRSIGYKEANKAYFTFNDLERLQLRRNYVHSYGWGAFEKGPVGYQIQTNIAEFGAIFDQSLATLIAAKVEYDRVAAEIAATKGLGLIRATPILRDVQLSQYSAISNLTAKQELIRWINTYKPLMK